MKKFIVLMFLVISFGLYGFNVSAAEVETIVDPKEVETEIVEDEEGEVEAEDTEATLEEMQAEIGEIIGLIFAYIGGLSGLGAVLAFIYRFLKDKGILNKVKSELNDALEKIQNAADKVDNLVVTVDGFSKNKDQYEKMVVQLLTVSNLDPKLKTQLLEALKNDTIDANQALEKALESTKIEVENKTQLINKIETDTQSLLEKLASKK